MTLFLPADPGKGRQHIRFCPFVILQHYEPALGPSGSRMVPAAVGRDATGQAKPFRLTGCLSLGGSSSAAGRGVLHNETGQAQ